MKLREIRLMRGLTQQQLAEKLGVLQVSISEWERGTKDPSTTMVRNLCHVLDCSSDELLGMAEITSAKSASACAFEGGVNA